MMRRIWSVAVCVLIVAFTVAGCAPPTVAVRHVLPGALPLPADVASLAAGEHRVRTGPAGNYAAYAREALAERLLSVSVASSARPDGSAAELVGAQVARVDGTIHIETKDDAGQRILRRLDEKTGEASQVTVPTLVRTATVRVEYAVVRAGAAEVRRAYNSAADATVRGELGLQRGDDPRNVPPVDEIIHRLLAQCAEAFVGMIAAVPIEAQVSLRSAEGNFARLGIDAAREGNYGEAFKQFAAAVDAAPDDPAARFNCAVAAEVHGKLDTAHTHYQRAWELSDRKDIEAEQGAARVRRVLHARQQAEKGS